MEWRDEAIVIGAKRHGETSVILELMTREHGRHLGLVRGGRSRRLQPVLQAGNEVEAHWRARLDEQLGTFQVEATRLRAAGLIGSVFVQTRPSSFAGTTQCSTALTVGLITWSDGLPYVANRPAKMKNAISRLTVGPPAITITFFHQPSR